MINLSEHYLAGVLDSDGSLSITKRHLKRPNPNYTVMIQITWLYSKASEDYFRNLKHWYGGSFFIGRSHSGFANPKPIIKYCATGKSAERILISCRNKLNLKEEQLKNLLQCVKLNNDSKKNRPIATSKKLEKLYKQNKRLNANP